MSKKEAYIKLIDFAPLLFLLIILIPLSIRVNPQIIPRFLGQTSHISQYGYLDLEHYIDIAEGLKDESFRTAFFPLWPFIIRKLHPYFNLDLYKTAIFSSSIIGLIAIIFSKYVLKTISSSNNIISISWILYVLSPITVFFFAGYTEPIFALQSWALCLCMIKILSSSDKNNFNYLATSLSLLFLSIGLSLTRPTLIQTIFSVFAANLSLLMFSNNKSTRYLGKVLDISILILLGTIIGYSIYGFSLINDGFRFFEPFYAQEAWQKSFGLRPIYLLTSRSSIIDLWGLYYPLILYASYLHSHGIKFERFLVASFYNLPFTLLYPPAGILFALITRKPVKYKFAFTSKIKHLSSSEFGSLEFLFLYAIFFSISHSLICFLTQPDYMRSLGRYIFGQPYFYVALSIFLDHSTVNLIDNKKSIALGSILISSIYLFKNFVEFGSARLSP